MNLNNQLNFLFDLLTFSLKSKTKYEQKDIF